MGDVGGLVVVVAGGVGAGLGVAGEDSGDDDDAAWASCPKSSS